MRYIFCIYIFKKMSRMRQSSTVMSQSRSSNSRSASVNINSNRSTVTLPLPTVKTYVSESERNSLHQLLNQMENPHTVKEGGGDGGTTTVKEGGGDGGATTVKEGGVPNV